MEPSNAPSLINLPIDALNLIASFMCPNDALALSQINKKIGEVSNILIKNHYESLFGEIKSDHKPVNRLVTSLICCQNQPNIEVDHNIYQAPSYFFERWKWMVELENSLDTEVQVTFNNRISLLKNTHATSIIQLKHQQQAFWHCNRQLNDYEKFKAKEQDQNMSGRFNTIFFNCLGFILSKFYNPSVSTTGIKLSDMSIRTFATIGGFEIKDKKYEVIASHHLKDDNEYGTFKSASNGITQINIYEIDKGPPVDVYFYTGIYFHIIIERALVNRGEFFRCYGECDEPDSEVTDDFRLLHVANKNYIDRAILRPQGSDRLLDQKLTQIMVEVTLQNTNICWTRTFSYEDDLPVLTAGGFRHYRSKDIMHALDEFRAIEGNKLFPPFEEYGTVYTTFDPAEANLQNVAYSKNTLESWSTILATPGRAILNPKAGILPEYWAIKPNIVNE